jgi:acetaldehyde dehydrogenase (acetylating)
VVPGSASWICKNNRRVGVTHSDGAPLTCGLDEHGIRLGYAESLPSVAASSNNPGTAPTLVAAIQVHLTVCKFDGHTLVRAFLVDNPTDPPRLAMVV